MVFQIAFINNFEQNQIKSTLTINKDNHPVEFVTRINDAVNTGRNVSSTVPVYKMVLVSKQGLSTASLPKTQLFRSGSIIQGFN